jgi:hypothetical protein
VIFDSSAGELFQCLEAAEAAEGAAYKRLNVAMAEALRTGTAGESMENLKALSDQAEQAHNAKWAIWQELQAFRLDK